MTDGSSRGAGLAAVGLFAVLAAVILNAFGGFPEPAGFPAGESVIHNIGYALFDIDLGEIASEGFLAAFLIIALTLDVALDSAVYLAKREDGGSIVSALTDGGQPVTDGGEVAETTESQTEDGGER